MLLSIQRAALYCCVGRYNFGTTYAQKEFLIYLLQLPKRRRHESNYVYNKYSLAINFVNNLRPCKRLKVTADCAHSIVVILINNFLQVIYKN